MSQVSRRRLLAGLGIAAAAGPAWAQTQIFDAQGGGTVLILTEAQIAAGGAFVLKHPSVDIHAQPGRFFRGGRLEAERGRDRQHLVSSLQLLRRRTFVSGDCHRHAHLAVALSPDC